MHISLKNVFFNLYSLHLATDFDRRRTRLQHRLWMLSAEPRLVGTPGGSEVIGIQELIELGPMSLPLRCSRDCSHAREV